MHATMLRVLEVATAGDAEDVVGTGLAVVVAVVLHVDRVPQSEDGGVAVGVVEGGRVRRGDQRRSVVVEGEEGPGNAGVRRVRETRLGDQAAASGRRTRQVFFPREEVEVAGVVVYGNKFRGTRGDIFCAVDEERIFGNLEERRRLVPVDEWDVDDHGTCVVDICWTNVVLSQVMIWQLGGLEGQLRDEVAEVVRSEDIAGDHVVVDGLDHILK
jgi:hypothetical protein